MKTIFFFISIVLYLVTGEAKAQTKISLEARYGMSFYIDIPAGDTEECQICYISKSGKASPVTTLTLFDALRVAEFGMHDAEVIVVVVNGKKDYILRSDQKWGYVWMVGRSKYYSFPELWVKRFSKYVDKPFSFTF